jgi:hypothetical protein
MQLIARIIEEKKGLKWKHSNKLQGKLTSLYIFKINNWVSNPKTRV